MNLVSIRMFILKVWKINMVSFFFMLTIIGVLGRQIM